MYQCCDRLKVSWGLGGELEAFNTFILMFMDHTRHVDSLQMAELNGST